MSQERPFSLLCVAASRPFFIAIAALALASAGVPECTAEQTPTAAGGAPPNHAVLKHAREGAFFVAKPLKQKYDQLLDRVKLIRAEIGAGRIQGAEARRQLSDLQSELDQLREEIEQKKVLVTAVETHTQTETTTFNLGSERLLVVTTDDVRVEGWDEPDVKCVLEKTLFCPKGQSADDQFKAIRVVHRLRLAPDLVGKTSAKRAAEEQKFQQSAAGQALTPRQRTARAKLLRQIEADYAIYRDFQGKEMGTLEIEGLTYEQGNRQMSVEVSSEGGETSSSGRWQRLAALTVYVPRCKAVLLRGCLTGLRVTGLRADLVVTSQGSHHRDYDGSFEIQQLRGSLTIDNAPIQRVEDIDGPVTILSTTELANTGTTHKDGFRTFYTPLADQCLCRKIRGDFSAWFSRCDLRLEAMAGKIDVHNEFGDTTLKVDEPLAEAAHRIVSQSGRVEVDCSETVFRGASKLPVLALTSCGTVRTNFSQQHFVNTSFTTGSTADGSRRDWRGVRSKREEGPIPFELFDRPELACQGSSRSPGIDLISRAGIVVLTEKKKVTVTKSDEEEKSGQDAP